jgi:sphingosine kinase
MHLLALVNPSAGDGKAAQLLHSARCEVFEPAGATLQQLNTTHLGHARDFLRALPAETLSTFDGIVVVSGDGLVAEVIQGLALRTDADIALRNTPIGPLPAGSGNGLCKSLLHASGYRGCDPLDAAKLICRGELRALDLAHITMERGSSPAVPSPFYSFLSVSWGLIADTDIEADFLR